MFSGSHVSPFQGFPPFLSTGITYNWFPALNEHNWFPALNEHNWFPALNELNWFPALNEPKKKKKKKLLPVPRPHTYNPTSFQLAWLQ